MAQETFKRTIGIFTIGGLLLFVVGIFFLGGQRIFSARSEYVLYFKGSVSGLSIGAPVVFRGVPLGNVTRISLVFDPRSSQITIPVYVHIDENSIVRQSGQGIDEVFQKDIIRHMVQNGLTARLQIQSLVTGQYRIELDYHGDTTPVFSSQTPNNEIPTVPSPIDELQQNLAKLPLREITTSLDHILRSLAHALQNGEDLRQGIAAFHGTFSQAEELLKKDIRPKAGTMLTNLESTTKSLSQELPSLLTSLSQTSAQLTQAIERIKRTGGYAEQLLQPHSPAMQDIRRLLKESAEAARSLHNLADMLNRTPEALLQGKKGAR